MTCEVPRKCYDRPEASTDQVNRLSFLPPSRRAFQDEPAKGRQVRKLVHLCKPFISGVQGTRIHWLSVAVVGPGYRHEEAGGSDAAIIVVNGHHYLERTRLGKVVLEKKPVRGGEGQGLRAGAIPVVHGRRPRVPQAGIGERPLPREQ